MGAPRGGENKPRFVVPQEVVSEALDGEAVVLNLETGKYFALNRTATRIWSLLRDARDSDEICEVISVEFAISPDTVRADFDLLAAQLLERGLLRTE